MPHSGQSFSKRHGEFHLLELGLSLLRVTNAILSLSSVSRVLLLDRNFIATLCLKPLNNRCSLSFLNQSSLTFILNATQSFPSLPIDFHFLDLGLSLLAVLQLESRPRALHSPSPPRSVSQIAISLCCASNLSVVSVPYKRP